MPYMSLKNGTPGEIPELMTTIFMQSVYNGNNEPPYLTNGRTIFLTSVIVKYMEKNHD